MVFAFGERVKKSDPRTQIVRVRGQRRAIQIARLLRLLEIKVRRGRCRLGISRHGCGTRRQRFIQCNCVAHPITLAQRAYAIECQLAFGRGQLRGGIQSALSCRVAVGERAVESGEARRPFTRIGCNRPPADLVRSAVGSDCRTVLGREHSGIAIGEFDGELRRAKPRERLDFAAQSAAMRGFQREYRLIGGQRAEVVAPGGRNVGNRFEHVDAARVSRAHLFDQCGCIFKLAGVGERARQPDLRIHPVGKARDRFAIQRFGQRELPRDARRRSEALDHIGRRGGAIDAVEQCKGGRMIARPAEHDGVIAEHVLALRKAFDQRAQCNKRLRGFSLTRLFDRIAVLRIRGLDPDGIDTVGGICSASGAGNDQHACHQRALCSQVSIP